MDATTLFAGLILGSIGLGFIVFGRKQKNPVALVCGVVLCGMPYFLSNLLVLILASIVAIALPFIIKF